MNEYREQIKLEVRRLARELRGEAYSVHKDQMGKGVAEEEIEASLPKHAFYLETVAKMCGYSTYNVMLSDPHQAEVRLKAYKDLLDMKEEADACILGVQKDQPL